MSHESEMHCKEAPQQRQQAGRVQPPLPAPATVAEEAGAGAQGRLWRRTLCAEHCTFVHCFGAYGGMAMGGAPMCSAPQPLPFPTVSPSSPRLTATHAPASSREKTRARLTSTRMRSRVNAGQSLGTTALSKWWLQLTLGEGEEVQGRGLGALGGEGGWYQGALG